jgi:PAS domain S-box-containing protein
LHENEPLPGEGFATYRLRVMLPNDHSPLALKILDMATACEIFVNGESIYHAGQPGTTKELSLPDYEPAVVALNDTESHLDMVVHVSNFHYRRGGMWESLLLGTHDDVHAIRENRLIRDAVLFGAILVIGLYHLTLFSSRRDRTSILWFGIFCILLALRILFTGERHFISLFPGAPWELLPRMEYLTLYLALPVFVLYMTRIFPRESVRLVVVAGVAVSLAFSLTVLVTPPRIFTHTLTAYQITVVVAAVYGFVVLIGAIRHRRPGSVSMLIGFFIFIATVANDILYGAEVIHTSYLASVGLLIFIFSQALHIARIFNLDFLTVKRQSAALEEANNIVNSSPAVALRWRAEPGWPVEFASANVASLTGYTAAELTTEHFAYAQLIHPDDLAQFQEEVASLALAPEPLQTVHAPYRITTKNGDIRWISDKKFMQRDSQRRIISYRGILEDVTDLKKANDELASHRDHLEDLVSQRTEDLELAKVAAEEASTAKSDFLASMSHELRTPLNHIIGFAGLVADGRVGSLTPEQTEYLNDALSSARHLLNLINEILDIAKVESGNLNLEKTEFPLLPFLDAILRSFREQASERQITIVCDSDRAPEMVLGDEQRVKQVLINLLSNAVKFSPDGGNVSVRVSRTGGDPERPGQSVLFAVADQGTGVRKADQERIFESFEQAKSSARRARAGTGLGLSISKSLVVLHGGDIWVESDGNGTGSTFLFTLPCVTHGPQEVQH